MRRSDQPFASINRHISGPVSISNGHVQNLNVRIRLPPLFPQDFKYAGDRFANIMLKLINGITLGVAARKCRDLSPKAALWIFVDDYGVVLHLSIFPQKNSAPSIPKFPSPCRGVQWPR